MLGKSDQELKGSFPPPVDRKPASKTWKTLLILSAIFALGIYLLPPDVGPLVSENPTTTAFIEAYKKKARRDGRDADIAQTWVPLSAIAPTLKNAVLIAEDDAFFAHRGVNIDQLKSAYEEWKKGKRLRGASTITQQLAKNLYLSPSRNPLRKVKEFIITQRLERELDKERILELYLNVIEWGDGIYGAEAASQHYFRKDAKSLDEREAVFLAAIIPNPTLLSEHKHRKRLKSRESLILSRMRRYEPLPPVE